VRDIISGACHQRYAKCLVQQKGRPMFDFCAAEENLEEELYLNQYSIVVSIQISTLVWFCL